MDNDNLVNFNAFRQRRLAKLQSEAEDASTRVEKRNRVKTHDYILMIGTALLFDAIQALLLMIPFLGWGMSLLVGIFAWLTFYLWTSIKGWGLSDTIKQFIVQYLIPFIELIPIINVLPTWTLRVILQLSFLKAEDVVYNTSNGKVDIEKISRFYKEVRNMNKEQDRAA